MLNQLHERRPLRFHLLILLFFAALTLLMTWPVTGRLFTHLAGGRDDLYVHQWTFWWLKKALLSGQSPFNTDMLYYPQGVSLTSHNIAWFNFILWLPLQAILGRLAAYNIGFLIVITLNGFCMYLFCRKVTGSWPAAIVSGIIFGFWPYTLSHFDHTNMMVLFWVPLTLLFINRLIPESSASYQTSGRSRLFLLLAGGLSMAMIGISRWQILIMSMPVLLTYSLYLTVKRKAYRLPETWINLGVVAGLSLLAMAPLASPLVIDQLSRDFPQDVFLDEPQWGRTDLLAYGTPSPNHGLWRDTFESVYQNFVVNQLYTPYLGYVSLLLVALGLILRWRQSWIWMPLALMYVILALGPELAINGRTFSGLPMPYRLFEDLIFLRLLRRPDRLNLLLSLPIAMLAGWGMTALLNWITRPALRKIVLIVTVIFILIDYWPVPFRTTAVEIPSWYEDLAADHDRFAVLDLPINDRSYDKTYMFYQTIHEKPLATGHVSRLPREAFDFLDSVPLLHELGQRDQQPDPALGDVGGQLGQLNDAGIRYLVLHKSFANDGLQNASRDWLTIEPTYEDDQLIVYRTAIDGDSQIKHFVAPELGLGLARLDYFPKEAVQGGSISIDARWVTSETSGEDLDVCLQLHNAQSKVVQAGCQALDALRPTSLWSQDEVIRIAYHWPIGEDIPSGDYDLTLAIASSGSEVPRGGPMRVGPLRIASGPRGIDTEAIWPEGIELLDYEIQIDEQQVTLTLFWRTSRPLSDSYKVFVHLADPQSSDIIAQSDTIPRNWTYATPLWQTGEIVRDVIDLPFDIEAGQRSELRLGLYEESSGRRLLPSTPASIDDPTYILLTGWPGGQP